VGGNARHGACNNYLLFHTANDSTRQASSREKSSPSCRLSIALNGIRASSLNGVTTATFLWLGRIGRTFECLCFQGVFNFFP
jgi:hypothetical protein